MRWIRIWLIRHARGRRADGEPSQLPLHGERARLGGGIRLVHLNEVTGTASLVMLASQTLAIGIGIVNGCLASRTGRLGGSVAAHGLHNAIAGVLTLAT